jgi:hypothetical protein
MNPQNTQQSKQWFYLFLGVSMIILIVIGATNYIVDPYQHYRKADFYKPIYDLGNQRYINPGIAKNYDYDSVIIGTSMTENTDLSEVEKKLKKRAINMSASGASAYEENLILQVALKTGKVKSVIWCLDIYSFQGSPTRFRFGEKSMPLYLYDDNAFNDYRYLLNRIVFRKALDCILAGHNSNRDVNRPYYWADKVNFSRKEALEAWYKLLAEKDFNKNVSIEEYTSEALEKSFDQNMLPHIVNNPRISFVIYFPPYSILNWVYAKDQGTLDNFLDFKKYVIDKLTHYNNVEMYDFQDIEIITFNLENYKDISHYSPKIDDFILDSISTKKYLVNSYSVDDRILRIKLQAMTHDIYTGP